MDTIRMLSIDPGSQNFGITVSELLAGTMSVIYSTTLNIDKLCTMNRYHDILNNHGVRAAKMACIEYSVSKLIYSWDVQFVVSESPYMGKFVQTLIVLIETIASIRRGILAIDATIPFMTVDPATVKRNVGVSGKSGDKTLILPALAKLDRLCLDNIDVNNLDEHSIDSIAVGYSAFVTQFIGR